MNQEEQIARMKALFEGDGTELKKQLIYAGLLLTIFERFKKYTVDQVDGFFSSEMKINNGRIQHTRGEKFKKIIKERGRGRAGQHTNEAFRAALHWFCDLGAVGLDEVEEIERIYNLRNEVGHELLRIIAFDAPPISLMDVAFSFGVYVKIVRWWVENVEAATDPDMTEEKYNNTDWGAVESIDTILLRQIMDKALSDDPQWRDLQEMARKFAEGEDRAQG